MEISLHAPLSKAKVNEMPVSELYPLIASSGGLKLARRKRYLYYYHTPLGRQLTQRMGWPVGTHTRKSMLPPGKGD